jgi:hypothetical protein
VPAAESHGEHNAGEDEGLLDAVIEACDAEVRDEALTRRNGRVFCEDRLGHDFSGTNRHALRLMEAIEG